MIIKNKFFFEISEDAGLTDDEVGYLKKLSANTIGSVAGCPPLKYRSHPMIRYPWRVCSQSGGDQWQIDRRWLPEVDVALSKIKGKTIVVSENPLILRT
jgi:hypothetical protein